MSKTKSQKERVKLLPNVTEVEKKETPPPSKPKFTVQAGSMEFKVTPIMPQEASRTPTVFYTPRAWTKIKRAIDMCAKEVGWLGTVDVTEDGDYLITDIFIPKQIVTHAETDIDAEDLADLTMSLEEPEKLLYWGHSHVNMGVGPSGQDEQQTAEYLEHTDFFIRGIYNKKGESKVDVFDMSTNLVYQRVRNVVKLNALSDEEMEAFEKSVTENVKDRVYNYYSTNNSRSQPSYNNFNGQKDFSWNDRDRDQPERAPNGRVVGRSNPFISRKYGGGWNG